MNTDEFVEDYFIKLFSKYKGFRKKPKISGVSIILENVPYDNKKVNSPDFLCVLKSREVIFEIFNASELFSMNSEIKFQPGKTIMYGITKQIFNKVVEKINENFNNITLQFRHPIILLINTDKSDIDPLNTVLMINSSNKLSENVLQNVKKKELISAVILTNI